MSTYLHNPRYLELHGRCRVCRAIPDVEPNLFVKTKEEVVRLGLLTETEYDEMAGIARAWFEEEIQRLEAMGWAEQAEQVKSYIENPRI